MKFDIIIQAGQSNSEGYGLGPVEKEYIPTDKVWQLDAPKCVTALPDRMDVVYLDEPLILKEAEESEGENGKIGNFGLTFSEEYIKAGWFKRLLLRIEFVFRDTRGESHIPQIPEHIRMEIARCLLPDIVAYFESEQGQREFEEWKQAQSIQDQTTMDGKESAIKNSSTP